MQFFKSAVVAIITFAAVAIAAPASSDKLASPGECKPLLGSCDVDSDCCDDLCVLGVSSILQICFYKFLMSPTIALHLNRYCSCPTIDAFVEQYEVKHYLVLFSGDLLNSSCRIFSYLCRDGSNRTS